jgi:hypothetical protein
MPARPRRRVASWRGSANGSALPWQRSPTATMATSQGSPRWGLWRSVAQSVVSASRLGEIERARSHPTDTEISVARVGAEPDGNRQAPLQAGPGHRVGGRQVPSRMASRAHCSGGTAADATGGVAAWRMPGSIERGCGHDMPSWPQPSLLATSMLGLAVAVGCERRTVATAPRAHATALPCPRTPWATPPRAR